MGKYSVPEEIRKLKPKGTIIKVIKNHYYVYTHSQYKDEKTGKWKTSPGKILGKIIPNIGLVLNDKNQAKKEIDNFNFGEYHLVCSLAKEEYLTLLKIFNPDDALTLFVAASIFSIEGYCGLKALNDYYEVSLFKRDFKDFNFSYYRIVKLLESIGKTSTSIKYQELLVTSAKDLAIDGHAIPTFGNENCLSSQGYKSASLKSEYINLITAIDTDNGMTIGAKMFPGYSLDKAVFSDFINDIGDIKDKCILVDMGFFSEDNLSLIETKKAFFVIPVSKNLKSYKEVTQRHPGRLKEFLYSDGKKSDLVEYQEIEVNNRRIIYFKNCSEADRLKRAYNYGLNNLKDGYTQEEYDKQKEEFGIIVLETNKKDFTCSQIYELYKKRWSIETYYNRLKNGMNFKGLNQDNYFILQGLAFLMILVGRIDALVLKGAKKVNYSRDGLIRLMKYLKLQESSKGTILHNKKKEHDNIINKLEIPFNIIQKCLPLKETEPDSCK